MTSSTLTIFRPDGVAAALLAPWLNKLFVMTARGSDLNVIGRFRLPAAQMRWAAKQAAARIVGRALADVAPGWRGAYIEAADLPPLRRPPARGALRAHGLAGDNR